MTPPGFLPVDVGGASAPRLFVGARSVDVASRLTEPGAAFLVGSLRRRRRRRRRGFARGHSRGIGDVRGQRDRRGTRLRMRGVRSSRGDGPQRLLHGGGRAGVVPNLLETAFRFDFRTRDATPPSGRSPGRRARGRLRRPRAIDQERNGSLVGGSGRGARADVRGGARGRRAAALRRRLGTRRYTRCVGEPLGAASRALPSDPRTEPSPSSIYTETAYDLHAVFADDQNANDPG